VQQGQRGQNGPPNQGGVGAAGHAGSDYPKKTRGGATCNPIARKANGLTPPRTKNGDLSGENFQSLKSQENKTAQKNRIANMGGDASRRRPCYRLQKQGILKGSFQNWAGTQSSQKTKTPTQGRGRAINLVPARETSKQ